MKKGENMKKKIKIAVFMMFCIFAFTGCTNSSDKSKKVESVEDITGAKIVSSLERQEIYMLLIMKAMMPEQQLKDIIKWLMLYRLLSRKK